VDFLLVITELFSLDVTGEALRAKIDRKSAISLQRGQFDNSTKYLTQCGRQTPATLAIYNSNVNPLFFKKRGCFSHFRTTISVAYVVFQVKEEMIGKRI